MTLCHNRNLTIFLATFLASSIPHASTVFFVRFEHYNWWAAYLLSSIVAIGLLLRRQQRIENHEHPFKAVVMHMEEMEKRFVKIPFSNTFQ